MKTQQVKIQVPKPCHEDWNKMTPKDKGAFCSSCEKVVVDFTKMSDRQIVDFLNENKGKKTCGKFNSFQVDRNISVTPPPPSNYYWRLKQLFVGVFVSLSFPGFSKSIEAPTNFKPLPSIDDKDLSINHVNGFVKDSYGNPIAAAYVRIYQNGRITKSYTVTDETGAFSLELPSKYEEKSIELRVTAQDYSNESIVFNGEKSIEVIMHHSKQILGKMAFMPIEVEEVEETQGQAIVSEIKTPCELPQIKGEIKSEEMPIEEHLDQAVEHVKGDVAIEPVTEISGNIEVEPVVNEEVPELPEIDFSDYEGVIMGDMIAVHPDDMLPKSVTGSVVDQYGEPLVFVTIMVENTEIGVTTDIDGNFKLALPMEYQQRESLTLKASYIGYEDQLITLNGKDAIADQIMLKITMHEYHYDLMGVMIMVEPDDKESPSSFDRNYQEPAWKEAGFNSRKEYNQSKK